MLNMNIQRQIHCSNDEWNPEALQNDALQNIIIGENEDNNNFDNILDIIFDFYEDFLNDGTRYESEKDLKIISTTSSGTLTSSASAAIHSNASSATLPSLSSKTSASSLPSIERIDISNSVSSKSKKTQLHHDDDDNNNNRNNASSKKQKINETIKDEQHPVTNTTKHKKASKIQVNEANKEKQQRLDYLMTVPKLISQAVNLVNREQLREIIETAFLPNCTVRTNALPNDITGRENVIAVYEGIFRMIPDFVMNVIPPTMNNRVITAKIFSSGTLCKKDDPSDYLFNHLKHRQDDEEFKEARQVHSSLIQQGKQMDFKSKSLMHLIINEEMTHIEKYIATSKTVNVSEAKFALSSSSSTNSV